MSVITSLNKRAANLAQKALRLGGDFVHPVSDDSGNNPDYNDPNNIISPTVISIFRTPSSGAKDSHPPRSLTRKPVY